MISLLQSSCCMCTNSHDGRLECCPAVPVQTARMHAGTYRQHAPRVSANSCTLQEKAAHTLLVVTLIFLSADPVTSSVLSLLMSMVKAGSLWPYRLRKNFKLRLHTAQNGQAKHAPSLRLQSARSEECILQACHYTIMMHPVRQHINPV